MHYCTLYTIYQEHSRSFQTSLETCPEWGRGHVSYDGNQNERKKRKRNHNSPQQEKKENVMSTLTQSESDSVNEKQWS